MRKVLTAAFLFAGSSMLLVGAAYWGYLRGIQSSSIYDANAYVATITEQGACIDQQDWDCVRVSSDMLASLLATRLKVLRDKGLVDESVAEVVDNYLQWHRDQEPGE